MSTRIFSTSLPIILTALAVQISVSAESDNPSSFRVRLLGCEINTSNAVEKVKKTGLSKSKISSEAPARRQSLSLRGTLAYIVQFNAPIREEWKTRLETAGARIRGYVPENAFIVEAAPDALEKISAIESVNWIGEYQADYKIQPRLKALAKDRAAGARKATSAKTLSEEGEESADAAPEMTTVTIITFSPDDVARVKEAVQRAGGLVLRFSRGEKRGSVRAQISPENIETLSTLGEVEWIEEYVPPKLHNNVAVESPGMNVSSVWTNYGLTGTGQVVAVADTGLDTGNLSTLHPDFTDRVRAVFALGRSNDWSDSNGHGTHTSGSVLGNGSAYSNGLFRGAAYGAELVFQSVMDSSGGLGGLPADLNDLFLQAYTNAARIHSDSWGSSLNGYYSADCGNVDEFMWNHPDMLAVFSAGNDGRDGPRDGVVDLNRMGAPGTAKNVLTVGAAENRRPAGSGGYSSYNWGIGSWGYYYPVSPISNDLISTSADGVNQGMAAFSSRGPCNDGRTKPDVVAPGTDIISCRSRASGAGTGWGTGSGVLGNSASNYYIFNGGTSMSTPLTAGAAALARQYLVERRGLANPSAALIKALLINGARSLTPGQYGTGTTREVPPAPRPNNVEGWGQVNLAGSLFPGSGYTNIFYDATNSLSTGGTNTHTFAANGNDRVSITLAWTDYPATLAAATKLVNDLDLLVIFPDGTTNYAFGRSDFDRINNVEGLDLDPAPAGTLTIKVIGYNIPSGPQPYALVIKTSAASSLTKATGPSPATADAGVSRSVKLSWGNAGGATTYNVYFGTNSSPGSNEFMGAQTATWLNPGNLDYRKTYYWRVDAKNSGGTITGDVWSFTTETPVIFSEGFENGGSIPTGWTHTNTAGTRDWSFVGGGWPGGYHPSAAHGGSYNACMYYNSYSDQRTKLISPEINFGAYTNNTELTFWHCMEDWLGDQDYLHVYYRTNATAGWTLLTDYTSCTTPWTKRTITLPFPTTNYYIAFEGDTSYGYGVCIDDVQVTGVETQTNDFTYIHYVSPNGASRAPYTNWADAATNIQLAVNAAVDGDTVLVTNGTYTLTSQITITNGITLTSVNGTNATFINGNYPRTTNICVDMCNVQAVIDGFTVSNGCGAGGGIQFNRGAVRNCLIRGNIGTLYGGGVQAYGWDSTCHCLVSNCTISGNTVPHCGGGIYAVNACIENCIIENNSASDYAGGIYSDAGIIRNCLVRNNVVTDTDGFGGGGLYATRTNIISSCTIVSNRVASGLDGGGFTDVGSGQFDNCIIYFNESPGSTYSNYYGGFAFSNCCFSPALSGSATNRSANNITSDPLFKNRHSSNYRLSSASPCVNAGANREWMTNSVDLDGISRISGGIVDMGAYELLATAPSAPTGVSATDGSYANKTRITWNSSSGASGYEIWRNTSDVSGAAAKIGTSANAVYDDTTGSIGTTYYYWVKATNSYGTSSFSSSDSGYRRTPVPGQLALSASSYSVNENAGSATITVTRSGGSDGAASVSYSSGDGTAAAGTDYTASSGTLSWPDGDSASKTISVPIVNRAGDQGSRSFTVNLGSVSGANLASPSSATVTIIDRSPATPLGVTASDGLYSDKILMYWDAVSVATGYKVWRATDNNSQNASLVGTSSMPVYLDTSVSVGSVYYYWIQSVNEAGASALSSPDNGYCYSPALNLSSPLNTKAGDGTYADKVPVTWQAVDNATEYEVWRAAENNPVSISFGMVGKTSGLSYNDTSAAQGVCYYYWVRAKNVYGYGGYSASDSGWKRLSPPATVNAGDGQYPYHIQVSWNAVANAGWYEVWREEVPGENSNGGNLCKVAEVGETSFKDYRTRSGVYYRYKVKACNGLSSSEYATDTGVRMVNASTRTSPPENDYDGDKLSDLALFNSSSGTFDVLCSGLGEQTFAFNVSNSQAASGDLDGDQKADPLVYCQDSAMWLVMFSNIDYAPIVRASFGIKGDGVAAAAADYDGDGLADPAVYRETDGQWFIVLSGGGIFSQHVSCSLGGPGYVSVPADYDGDRLADPAVYSETEGRMMAMFSGDGYSSLNIGLGGAGQTMCSADFDGDGKADPALYGEASGQWTILLSGSGYCAAKISLGGPGYSAAIGDYDGDGKADPAVYRQSDGQWTILLSSGGYSAITENFGGSDLNPVVSMP